MNALATSEPIGSVVTREQLVAKYPEAEIDRAVRDGNTEYLRAIEEDYTALRRHLGLPTSAKEWKAVFDPHGFSPPGMHGDGVQRPTRYIYFIQSGDLVKVGITYDIRQRMASFRAGAPRGLYLRGTREVPAVLARQVEKQTHEALKRFAKGREWFKTTPPIARAAAEPIIKRAFACEKAMRAAGWYNDWG